MQYNKKAFSSTGGLTMIPKNQKYLNTIGNKGRLQFLDYKMVNMAYCSNKCNGGVRCANNGYENPNNCGTCKCPYTLTGKTCTEYIMNKSPECGNKNDIKLGNEPVTIKPKGKNDCVYYITAPAGKKVRVLMGNANLASRGEACYSGDALEIQYLKDKSLTGVMFCGRITGKLLESEDSLMIVVYTGNVDFNYAELTFSAV